MKIALTIKVSELIERGSLARVLTKRNEWNNHEFVFSHLAWWTWCFLTSAKPWWMFWNGWGVRPFCPNSRFVVGNQPITAATPRAAWKPLKRSLRNLNHLLRLNIANPNRHSRFPNHHQIFIILSTSSNVWRFYDFLWFYFNSDKS